MKAVVFGIFSSAMLISNVSHALVNEVVHCTTPGGQYVISVLDNQGTSFTRTQHLTAYIKHQNGVTVASYPVQPLLAMGSASFGRPTLVDSATNGSQFKIAGPSTNERNYIFAAQTSIGAMGSDALVCSSFAGVTY